MVFATKNIIKFKLRAKMQIDKGFYSITQANSSTATLSSKQTNSQEFSQILAQTMQSQDTQSQAKLSGNAWQDWQNGLISFQEYETIDLIMDATKFVAGYRLAWQKTGIEFDNFDINYNEYGLVKQREILENGDKTEKEKWLNSYKQVLKEGSVMPRDGTTKAINAAIEYIDKVLNSL